MPYPPFPIGDRHGEREAKLAVEQARGLHPFDGRDLLAELEELHVQVAGVKDERATEGQAIDVGFGDLQCPCRHQDVAHPRHSEAPKDGSRDLGGGWSHPGAPTRGAHLRHRSLGPKSGWPPTPWSLGYCASHFFFLLFCSRCNIHINIYIYIYIGKLVPLHLRFHGSPTVASRGPMSHARQATPPRWGHPS
jgi:hypothetical protein